MYHQPAVNAPSVRHAEEVKMTPEIRGGEEEHLALFYLVIVGWLSFS